MRPSLILFAACCLLTATGNGQQIPAPPTQWQRVFGGYANDFLFSLQQTRDGGYLLGGDSGSPAGGNKTAPNFSTSDYWIVRLDANGNQLWDRSFGGFRRDILTSLQETAGGGFVIGGGSESTTNGNKTTEHFGTYATKDFWVIRLDTSGNKIWEQNFGGTYDDPLRRVQQIADNGFFLCGGSASPPSGNKTATNYGSGPSASSDFWVVRLDANGSKLWDKAYGGINEDLAWNAQITSDGGLILGGGSISDRSGTKTSTNFGDYDFWVVRLDANGNQLWDRSFGGTQDDTLYALREMPDSGFVLAGRSLSPPSGNKTSTNYGLADFWVVRLDVNGNKLWDQSFGGTEDDLPFGLDVTRDGGIIIGGRSFSVPSGNKTATNFGGGDFWIVRLDADGQKLWEADYGGSRTDGLESLQQTRDGGFILGGHSYSPADGNKTVPQFFFADYWVIKLGPEQPWLRLIGPPFSPEGLRLVLSGVKNLTYAIEYSTNLASWTPLQTNRMTSSIVEILDSSMTISMQRFYRARVVE